MKDLLFYTIAVVCIGSCLYLTECEGAEYPFPIGGHTLNFYNVSPVEIVDQSGNGNDGVNHGAEIGNDDGFVVNFDGSSYLALSQNISSDLVNKPACTFAGWIKRDSVGQEVIVILTISGTTAKYYMEFNTDNTVRLGGRAKTTDAFQSKSTVATFTDTAWHHYVAIVDVANDDIKVYVDGAEQTMTGSPAWSQTYFDADVGTSQRIGVSAGDIHFFSGQMDILPFYTRTITPTEITALYNAGRTAEKDVISTNGLIAFYDFQPPDRLLSITNSL